MKRTAVFVIAGVAGALVAGLGAGVGVGVATAGSGGEKTGPQRAPVAAAAVNDSAVENHYTTVAPCLLVNSQAAGGALAPSEIRTYRATGTAGFPAQGGKSGGCAIPDAATAVQVVMTGVGASANGSFKAGPNGSVPGVFMNYARTFDTTGSGVISLNAGRFRIQNLTGTTNVRVDVVGYFIPPIWAHVSADGALLSGSRILSSVRLDVGRFQLVVDRDVSHCGVTAQSTGFDQSDIWLQAFQNTVTVDVELPATANTQDDDEVYVTITC